MDGNIDLLFYLVYSEANSKLETYEKVKYFYNSANYEDIRNDLKKIEWSTIIRDDISIHEAWDNFYNTTMQLIERHVPKKVITCNKSSRWNARWIAVYVP